MIEVNNQCVQKRKGIYRYIFNSHSHKYSNFYIAIICFFTALTIITACSELSFLIGFSDSQDLHCFFTVGNSILHGYIPYRDIYEQKGPILYMFFAICAFVSSTSFVGVYIFEIICGTIFLYFAYKTIQLFREVSIVWIIVFATFVYSASAFCLGGEGEEFALPLLMYAIYIIAKSIKTDKAISYRSAFFIGLTATLIFWFKYTILGFYFGLALAVIILRAKKDGRKLFYDLLFLIGGILIVSIPVLIYFGANNAINDMFTAYFYNNMFLYTQGNILNNFVQGLGAFASSNTSCFILLVLSIMYYIRKRKEDNSKKLLLLILSVSVLLFLISYFGGHSYYYYSLPFCVLAPFGIIALSDYGQAIGNKTKKYSLPVCIEPFFVCIVCIICVLYSLFFSSSASYRKYEKEDLPQFQFAEIIKQEDNPTLLSYDFMDFGFYTAAEVLPTCKYFCWLDISLDESYEMQEEFVQDGKVDFIVTLNRELDSPIYEEVAKSYYEPRDFWYRLYKHIN